MTIAYKVLTHDLRPPIQGGDPLWSGNLPCRLPSVIVDEGDQECAAGWNACGSLSAALRIGGLWPGGRPSRAFVVTDPEPPVVLRGDKIRAASWNVQRECSEAEIATAIDELSRFHFSFGNHDEHMAASMAGWRRALSRPTRDPSLVERHLALALERRGLVWTLRRFESAWDAGSARSASWAAWDAWAARSASWAAWDAWAGAARAARSAWGDNVRAACAAWDARSASWAAWDAWDALTVEYAALCGWLASWVDRIDDRGFCRGSQLISAEEVLALVWESWPDAPPGDNQRWSFRIWGWNAYGGPTIEAAKLQVETVLRRHSCIPRGGAVPDQR